MSYQHPIKIRAVAAAACLCVICACGQGRPAGAPEGESPAQAADTAPKGAGENAAASASHICPEALLGFFEANGRSYAIGDPVDGGAVMQGKVLEEFKGLDEVKRLLLGYSSEGMTYRFLGSIKVAEGVGCLVFSAATASSATVSALVIRDGAVTGGFMMEDDGADSGFRTSTAAGTGGGEFIVSTFSLDMVNEDGSPKGGKDRVSINGDGTVAISPCDD